MTCQSARRRLAAFHDRELPVEDQIAVQAHLDACPACAHEAAGLGTIGESLREMAAISGAGWHRELAGLPSGVVSRLKAERDASLFSRIGRLFEDMHFVWAAGGATMATLACGVIIHGLLLTAARERPDSLAGVLAALAASGSNDDPVRLGSRVALPRADGAGDMVMPAAVFNHGRDDDDAALALSAVVTREGTLSNLELLGPGDHQHDIALERDTRALLEILDAASTARFQPARYEGMPVAVNVVWLLAHTTVRANKTAVTVPGPWHEPVPAPAVVAPPAVKQPSSDSSSGHETSVRRRSLTTTA